MGNWAAAQPNSVEATHEAVNRKPISSDQPTAATRSHSPATSPPSHAAAFHPSLPPPATSMDLVRSLAALPAPPLPLPAQLTKARHGPQPSTTSAPVPAAGAMLDRRRLLFIPAISISIGSFQYAFEKEAAKAEFADMPALRGKDYGKTKMRYPDYTETESGLQYKDLRVGDGPSPKKGETVVVDWDGYTIGYYGRIFEARNKTKGGSFEGGDKDFFKFKLGSGQVIPAFEEAISGMAPGGVRRIIVPPDLGYPDNDYNKLGPKPTTFSGQRALDFVLRNQGKMAEACILQGNVDDHLEEKMQSFGLRTSTS